MPPQKSINTAIERSQQSRSSSLASKRKDPPATKIEEAEASTPPKKSRPSIAELVSSQGSLKAHSDAASSCEVEETRDINKNGAIRPARTQRPRTFADMYTFTSRTRPNGVIDLTQSKSPVSKPVNGVRPFGQIGQGGPKRLVVKNLRTTPKVDPQDYFERKWQDQSAALDSLFQGRDVKIMLEELYKATEHICRQGKAAELFSRLDKKCRTHLTDTVTPQLLKICETQPGTGALQAFVDAWALWQTQVQTIRHIYFYLNQTYLLRNADHRDITAWGTKVFTSIVFLQGAHPSDPDGGDIKDVILKAAVDLVQQDRKADRTHATLLKSSVSAFHDLHVYDEFASIMIDTSRKWFRQWRREEAEKEDLPHYVQSCSAFLVSEKTRGDTLSFDWSTRKTLFEIFDQILVMENVSRLSDEDGVLDMLDQGLNTEIEQCWSLLTRVDEQHRLSNSYAKFTELEGSTIVFDEKNEVDMVVNLLTLKRKLDHLHTDCFHKDEQMGNTLHKSFETFMNKSKKSQANWDTDNAKPGEMIAKHIDLLLKGGAKAIPKLASKMEGEGENDQDFDDNETEEESIEKHLSDALDLFRFVHGKAVFEAFYKKDLARRLLMGRTQSFDAERSMLARLRNECGANFTHNLESMFKDMDLAREEMKAYNQLLSDKGTKPPVEIAVNVLSVAAWPTYSDVPVNLPTSILKSQHDFEQHFKAKHIGRKLTFKPSLAHCQLKARFTRGAKELVVSGFQAVVLLLFNDISTNENLGYEQIRSATNLPAAELKRTLQSLACAKYKVLSKTPKGREVNDTDTFGFNDKFTDSRFRVKINQIQLKETKEENKETHQRVAADRHYETQAAIVRIMKSRKKIGHNELIVEVIKATRSRGVLDQADIKKNIEKLIEKDYMEREDEIRGYSYLA